MIKFLVIEQDLRISGTSQGVISRSFLSKLRTSYPDAVIDVVYIKTYEREDRLDLLPVNNIISHLISTKIPFFIKFINRFYWRLFHVSLNDVYIEKQFGNKIKLIDYKKYDHVFLRSAGLSHEILLGAKDLPILKNAIINFHEPYPEFWCSGGKSRLTNLQLFKHKAMFEVICQAKTCMATETLANDMQYLYGTRKKFHYLPHQYDAKVFDFSDNEFVIKKTKKVNISYHGAIQFGRNIEILLDIYQELVSENLDFKENTEFILRMKGIDVEKLKIKYKETSNIIFLDLLNFANSSNEQIYETDIPIILENGPIYCNIQVGKAAFLANSKNPIFILSPERSELRKLIKDQNFMADYNDSSEIKKKFKNLISNRLKAKEEVFPFGDYFSNENFKLMLDKVLNH
jgi:hypothetical protein